jgi:hypothetical protein
MDNVFTELKKQFGLTDEEIKEFRRTSKGIPWRLRNDRSLMERRIQIWQAVKIRMKKREPELRKFPDFFNDFSDRLLVLVPPQHLERAYEPSKCDAEANRLELLQKDGNEAAANRGYRREMCKVVLITFLTLPMFLMDEILGQVRRMVAR